MYVTTVEPQLSDVIRENHRKHFDNVTLYVYLSLINYLIS